MGKLNYINRKTSGPKLGSTVQKDVIKHSQMASKARSAKDPHLEVNLQGKALGDEGLQIACEGFVQALSTGFVKLDELNISENKITVSGLKFLAPVIQAASGDLKDLDLKGNELLVSTCEEETVWEQFLNSFRNMCCLRRIDFSDNPIGNRGFEILWRVYAREPTIRLPRILGIGALEEDVDKIAELEEDPETEEIYDQARRLTLSEAMKPPSPPTSLNSTPIKKKKDLSPPRPLTPPPGVELHGLRSVPFIVLCRTEITDCSALLLSYIIPIHPLPERLMPYIPAAKIGYQTDLLEAYNTTSCCSGIIYKPNHTLSAIGSRLLECAEHVRKNKTSRSIALPANCNKHWRNSDTELYHIRAKIQGNVIKDYGADHVQLWGRALRMLVLCRSIFFANDNSPLCKDRSKLLGNILSVNSASTENSGDDTASQDLNKYSPPPSPTLQLAPRAFHNLESLSGSQPQWTENISKVIMGEIPVIVPLDLPPLGSLLNIGGTEKLALPGQLPERVWIGILQKTADPSGLLSHKQCRRIVEWAKSKETLEKERELSGKLMSLQIWRVLDGMNCLSYSV